MSSVLVVLGPGQIGLAIARRVGIGKHILLADKNLSHAQSASTILQDAGFTTTATQADVSSRANVAALVAQASALGPISGLVHAAGVSPSQAPKETVLKVDLYGVALVLELFGGAMAPGGAAVVIASMSGHRLPALTPEQNKMLATAPAEQLLDLPFLQPEEVRDSLHAYQLAKRGNALRVMGETPRWARRGARVNAISPGIVMTPLARDELNGPRGEGYRRMRDLSAAGRVGTPDEVASVAALMMGPEGGFVAGSDWVMDGGVTASWYYGELAPQ